MTILKQNKNKVIDLIIDSNPNLFEGESLIDELREFLTERDIEPVKGNYRQLMMQALQYVVAQNYMKDISDFVIPSDFPKEITFDFSQYQQEENIAYDDFQDSGSYFYDIDNRLSDVILYCHRKREFCLTCGGCRMSKLYRIDKRKEKDRTTIPF